jgi:hypothetical protein
VRDDDLTWEKAPADFQKTPSENGLHYTMNFKTKDGNHEAFVKWDGCVEVIWKGHPPNPDDQVHFCDLDREIERLTKLRDACREFFGPHFDAWSTES